MRESGKNFMIERLLRKLFFKHREEVDQKRGLNLEAISSSIYQSLDERYEYPWIMDFVVENQRNYVVFTDFGKLYRAEYVVQDNIVTLLDAEEVRMEYTPLERSRISIRREDDRLILYGIASAATLNRVGEIDSTKLFDSFEKQYEEKEYGATLRFYHVPEWDFGTIDYVGRLNNVLLFVAEVDKESKFAKQIESVDLSEYGFSIGFASDDYSVEQIGETNIRVFNSGTLVEISLLKEKDAASYFTGLMGVDRMGKTKEKMKEELLAFIGDEQAADELLEQAEIRNRTIEGENLVRREGAPDEAPEETEEEDVTEEIVVDDGLVEQIAEKVYSLMQEDAKDTVAVENPELDEIRSSINKLEEMISQLVKADEQKVQEIVEKMPEGQRRFVAKSRPTVSEKQEKDDILDARKLVAERLANFKKKGN